MAEENITTSKVVYGAKSANEFIDNSFSELFKTKDPININRFFSMYDDLFYNIPKLGDKSHTTLINKSKNYTLNYIDPLQLEVDNLTEENIRLTEQLNESTEEHPFYSNGTLLANPSNDGTPHGYGIYYMDKGLAREVIGDTDDDTFIALKASLGYPSNIDYKDIILAVPQSIIDGLNKGPKLDIEDIAYPKAEEEEQRLAENLAQQNQQVINEILTEDWFTLDGGVFLGSPKIKWTEPDFKSAVLKAWEQERSIEILRNKYLADINYGYTIEEQENGQILLDSLLIPVNKLNASRDKIVMYERIWNFIMSSSADGIYMDFSSPYYYSSTFLLNYYIGAEANVNGYIFSITDEERDKYKGKWNINDTLFENFQGLFQYDNNGNIY
tara:strand:+ start:220 stop:1374 length:1155 start_codon:yes stop_codon:yes gene_type:complete